MRRGLLAVPIFLATAGAALAMGGGAGGGMGGGMGGGGMSDGGTGSGGMGGGGMGDGGTGSGGMEAMRDHDMALEQHRSGMTPPLRLLMRQVGRKYPGKVLNVRMVRDSRGSAYVFTIMQGNRILQVRMPLSTARGRKQGGRSYNFNSDKRR